MKKRLKEIQKEVSEKLELFTSRNLFNKYLREDFIDYVRELENQYNVDIDYTTWKVSNVWR